MLNEERKEKKDLVLPANTTNDFILDTAFIIATDHTEETLLTPVLVPAVGKKPVFSAVINTITKQLDSVVTKKAAADVMIDTRSIDDKVLINGKAGLAGTLGGKLLDDIVMTLNVVDIAGIVLIVLPDCTVLASASAIRSRIILAWARILAAWDVVIARGERIRTAVLSHNTILVPVHEGIRGLTTITATTTRASKHILSAKNNILLFSDASTIADCSNRTDSPARTTSRLITNHSHRRAVRIMVTRIIGLRSSDLTTISTTVHEFRRMLETLRTSTKQSTNLLTRKTRYGGGQ